MISLSPGWESWPAAPRRRTGIVAFLVDYQGFVMPKRTADPEHASAGRKESVSLFLDKEGRWFHEGVEVTHARTCLLFAKNIRRDPTGRYYVRVGPESAEVVVEDAPYTIRSVTVQETHDGRPQDYILHLNDETQESLESGSLFVGDENVMYCKVKEGSERARFLRAAYYQICSRLEYDERSDRYWLPCNDRRITISSDRSACPRAEGGRHTEERTRSG